MDARVSNRYKRVLSLQALRNAIADQGVREVLRRNAVVVIAVALFVTLAIASDPFLTSSNLVNVVNQSAPLAIIASAGTLVIIAGGFDLSTGAIFGLASVAGAWVAVKVDPIVGLLAAPTIGAVAGLVNGLVITGLRVHSFLVTLATSLVFGGVAVLISGGFLIPVRDHQFTVVGQGHLLSIPGGVVVFGVFSIVASVILRRTIVGRYVYAVGGNSEAAELSGVAVPRIVAFTFFFSGLAAGIAGMVAVSKIASGEATSGTGLELRAIAAIILGGSSVYGGEGAVWRSVVGVLLLAMVANGFNLLNADPFYRDLTTGVVIIFAVALSASSRRTRRRKPGSETSAEGTAAPESGT